MASIVDRTSQLPPTLERSLPRFESNGLGESERLTLKLVQIMCDPDLNFALEGYMRQLIIPGMVAQRELTREQAEHVLKVAQETTECLLNAALTREQQEAAKNAARRDRERHRVSDFARW